MTAPVVEILGKTLRCQPELFAAHMQHYGNPWRTYIDNVDKTFERQVIGGSCRGPSKPISSFRHRPYFSFPFRRKLKYRDNEGKFQHAQNRTMFRDYNEFHHTIEERISGALYTGRGSPVTIG